MIILVAPVTCWGPCWICKQKVMRNSLEVQYGGLRVTVGCSLTGTKVMNDWWSLLHAGDHVEYASKKNLIKGNNCNYTLSYCKLLQTSALIPEAGAFSALRTLAVSYSFSLLLYFLYLSPLLVPPTCSRSCVLLVPYLSPTCPLPVPYLSPSCPLLVPGLVPTCPCSCPRCLSPTLLGSAFFRAAFLLQRRNELAPWLFIEHQNSSSHVHPLSSPGSW